MVAEVFRRHREDDLWTFVVAEVFRRHREDDLWTFLDCLWIFLDGLSLECLWTAWNGFQLELDWISAAICVCGQVAQAMATGEMEELYWLLFFVYTLGFLSGILSAYCITKCCKSRNTTARNSGTAMKSSTALSCDSDGEGPSTRIYWSFCREMYHCSEKCKVLIAAAGPNGHIRCRDNCQVCQPETGPLLVVTSTGSKYHCSGCRTTEKSKQMTLLACPICYGMGNVKAE